MRKRRQRVEQIVVVTDEQENTSPVFTYAYGRYREQLEVEPDVVVVRVGRASNQLEEAAKSVGAQVDTLTFGGDYYSLPNLVPLLTRPSRLDLLLEILDVPLPKRQDL